MASITLRWTADGVIRNARQPKPAETAAPPPAPPSFQLYQRLVKGGVGANARELARHVRDWTFGAEVAIKTYAVHPRGARAGAKALGRELHRLHALRTLAVDLELYLPTGRHAVRELRELHHAFEQADQVGVALTSAARLLNEGPDW